MRATFLPYEIAIQNGVHVIPFWAKMSLQDGPERSLPMVKAIRPTNPKVAAAKAPAMLTFIEGLSSGKHTKNMENQHDLWYL